MGDDIWSEVKCYQSFFGCSQINTFASAKLLRQDWSSESAAGIGERGGDTWALQMGVTGSQHMGDDDSDCAHFQDNCACFRDMFPRSGSSPEMNCIISPSCWLGVAVDGPGPVRPRGLGPGSHLSWLPWLCHRQWWRNQRKRNIDVFHWHGGDNILTASSSSTHVETDFDPDTLSTRLCVQDLSHPMSVLQLHSSTYILVHLQM